MRLAREGRRGQEEAGEMNHATKPSRAPGDWHWRCLGALYCERREYHLRHGPGPAVHSVHREDAPPGDRFQSWRAARRG